MPQPAQNGIDIREALEILSLRKDDHPHERKEGACCCTNSNLPHEQAKSWGQRIDLNADDDGKVSLDQLEKEKEELQQKRVARQADIKSRMNSLSTKELISCVMQTQADRVAAYRMYDHGLDGVLQSGNLAHYPQVCAEATATFSVLSETINAVRSALKEKNTAECRELCDLISKLQNAEKTKLSLTAALHLEKVRSTSQTEIDSDANGGGGVTVSELHQRDMKSLQQGIASSVAEINDVLEELKFAAMDDEE